MKKNNVKPILIEILERKESKEETFCRIFLQDCFRMVVRYYMDIQMKKLEDEFKQDQDKIICILETYKLLLSFAPPDCFVQEAEIHHLQAIIYKKEIQNIWNTIHHQCKNTTKKKG